MDFLEKDILDYILQIRGKSKRPDAESIFKHLRSNSATNLTMEVVEESIKILIAKSKVINKKTKQGLDSFFIIDDQTEPEIELNNSMITANTSGCLQKDTPRKSVNLSEETPSLSNLNYRSLDSYNIEELWP